MLYRNPKVESNLIDDEGIQKFVYKDSLGFDTIGIGRCVSPGKEGLTVDECMYLLRNDITNVYTQLLRIDWFNKLDIPRQNVIIEMTFNLGLQGMLGFKGMISAIQEQRYTKAAIEMLNSKWATQVKGRAARLAKRMEFGID